MDIRLFILNLVVVVGTVAAARCRYYRADIVFMLDVSSSVHHANFKHELGLLTKIIRRYPIGPKDVQIGTITYSDDARVPFHLKTYGWKHLLLNAVKHIQARGGDTDTSEAIRVARVFSFLKSKGARGKDIPKIGILITDGLSRNARTIREEGQLAKEDGIILMAIGIGLKYKSHLERITKTKEHIFNVDRFDQLEDLAFALDKVIQPIACEEELEISEKPAGDDWRSDWVDSRFLSRSSRRDPQADMEHGAGLRTGEEVRRFNSPAVTEHKTDNVDDTSDGDTEESSSSDGPRKYYPQYPGAAALRDYEGETRCTIAKADILFVMDESSSIWPEYFKKQMEFAARVVSAFNIQPDSIRIGAITFSTKARIQFNFKDYITKDEVVKALLETKQTIGHTSTWEALKLARTYSFRRNQGSRGPEVPKIAFVITDGNSQETYWTLDEATLLKSTGVKLFAIGVGKNVSDFELKNIASGADFILAVENYDKLLDITSDLIWKACGAKFAQYNIVNEEVRRDCNIGNGTALSFLLDMKSLDNFDRAQAMDFMKEVIASIPVERQHVQVSFLSRKCGSLPNFYSQKYRTTEELLRTLSDRRSDDMTSLLHRTRQEHFGKELKAAKIDIPRQIVVVITDHAPKKRMKAVAEALQMRRKGAEIFVFGVGGNVEQTALRLVASVPHDGHVFLAPGYQFLQYHRSKLVEGICGNSGS
ncbi:matrilin-1-like isoform X2 [Tubulanus polymorphus]|uniref:matrilin-1-like isoform X2 n=1 Tax=Tubulanus polymorphus TaxID=672921 RepID=UPI003DA2832B